MGYQVSQYGSAELRTFGQTKASRLGFSTLAILAFVCCALTGWHTAGYVFGALNLIGLTWLFLARNRDRLAGTQILVLAGFLIAYARRAGTDDAALAVIGVATACLLLNQELFAGAAPIGLANLRGRGLGRGPLLPRRAAATSHTALVALIGLGAAVGLPVWVAAVCTAAVAAAAVAHLGREVLRHRRRGQRGRQIRTAVERLRPEFAIYFSAPPETEYQVTMWLPYLERIGRPFMIIVREEQPLATFAALTRAPVIVCPAVKDVDNLVVPSLRAIFYVNNGMKNTHMVRFNHLTHIQLLHGDSDKASSYNPVTAMFDRIYVAGQAAIDRYAANGVVIDPEKFQIVGRPQVEAIHVAPSGTPMPQRPTVLYGTTWAGLYSDANYCSLEIGEKIVGELLRREVTVIFRPHPYVARNPETRTQAERVEAMLAADRAATGRPHIFGPAAADMRLFDCFNRADAMISDVSGIASDFLYSEKPLAMTDMAGDGADFARKFPVSTAAYVIDARGANVATILDELLGNDSLAARRRQVKRHYLGDFPADGYAQAFVDAARRDLATSPVRAPAVV